MNKVQTVPLVNAEVTGDFGLMPPSAQQQSSSGSAGNSGAPEISWATVEDMRAAVVAQQGHDVWDATRVLLQARMHEHIGAVLETEKPKPLKPLSILFN